ncbi:MAG TPA: hypothetical protein VFK40_05530 [Nitrososphaeraceae archaeon]|nr:hypothetical protein [Nitrososphaeraceae archaeon]
MNERKNNWFRRRWLDFRQGHSIYLVFIMTFANFITIQYKLVLQNVPVVDTITGGSIFGFAIFFVALYVPLGILIGYWHRKSQWKVEAEALFKENRIGATMWLFVIDLIDGKISEEEKQEMREMLLKITKGKKFANDSDETGKTTES